MAYSVNIFIVYTVSLVVYTFYKLNTVNSSNFSLI